MTDESSFGRRRLVAIGRSLALVVCCVFVTWLPARADEAALARFYGSFEGEGLAESPKGETLQLTARTMSVRIGAADNGFELVWSAVIWQGRESSNPTANRKTSRVVFEVIEGADFYVGRGSGNPAAGNPLWWARVDGDALTVQVLTIDKRGRLDHQTYRRTLTAEGMELVYTREREGEVVRRVRGALARRSG